MGKAIIGNRIDRRRARRNRLLVLIGVLVVTSAAGVLHQFPIGARPPGVDALCPFGGLEALYALIASGSLLAKIASSSFVLLVATILIALLFRRSFCGNICPLGTLQELAGRLGKRLFHRRFTLPARVDRGARYLKYAVLALVVFLSAAFGTLVIRPYDPWVAYQHLTSTELLSGSLVGLVLLIVMLAASLFYDRFFCKYLCPMGAFLALVGKLGAWRVRRNPTTCTSCGACDRACPMNIKVSKAEAVTSAECIACNLCVTSCPVPGALEGSLGRKTYRKPSARPQDAAAGGVGAMRHALRVPVPIRPTAVSLLSLLSLLLVAAGATLAGQFQWAIPSIAERSVASGIIDPAQIKGSDTFQDVARASGIAESRFAERFGLLEADLTLPIKEAAHREGSGFDVDAVRGFVAAELGQGVPAAIPRTPSP